MVWSPGAVSVTFHNAIVFQCYSLYFISLLAMYTEVKYQLTQYFFFKNILFDELLSEIGNVLYKKGELNLTMST